VLVTVRLFARLREIAGASELPVEVASGATVRDAWRSVAARYQDLGAYEHVISCAVNEEYARFTAELREGDEVAFLPPVSGGTPLLETPCSTS
jgi:molybdopterin converting factor subunit 1